MTRPRLRTTLIVILLMLIPIGLHQLWDYLELRRLVAEIEAVIAKGEPVSETQAFPNRSPEQRDAGEFYIAAGMITNYASRNPVTPVLEWLSGAEPEPAPSQAQLLREYVARSKEALSLADRAAAMSFSTLPPGTDYNYRTSHVLSLATVMGARTLALSWDGQGDAAAESVLSTLGLRRIIRHLRWPFLYNIRNDTAAVLSLSRPSPEALARLQRALESEDARDDVFDGLLADRARAIESVWRRYYGPSPAAPRDYRLRMRGVIDAVRRPLTTRRAVTVMRRWAELIDAARRPWPERVRAIEELGRRHGPPDDSREEHMFLFPSAGTSDAPYALITPRAVVTDRASIAAIAVERYRRDHGGALPVALSDLVPRYVPRVPVDPYSGGAMLLVKDAASYRIYSVGPDGNDDGGDLISVLQDAQRRGFGPRPIRGKDQGIRVLTTPLGRLLRQE
jgi:hypothetical protein